MAKTPIKSKKKASKSSKRILTPEQKRIKEEQKKFAQEKKRYANQVRTVFINAGFKRLHTDGKNINFRGRSGEIDDIFLYENVLVVCEQTCAKNAPGQHLMNKNYLFGEISSSQAEFAEFAEYEYPEFNMLKKPSYDYEHYKVVIVYCSKYGVSEEHKGLLSSHITFLDYNILYYFIALTATIKLSSRFEIFDFLGLKYNEVGENIISTKTGANENYEGSILPESHSSFDKGYKVVTFYIDPESLISRAYVLRKDGWIDGGVLYQRALIKSKVTSMRNYLREEKRVFVNNIIATLSEGTRFVDENNHTRTISEFKKTSPVRIGLPEDFNSICIIDGQHRLYAYHERDDKYEGEIASLRKKQNLLVTAIYYPEGTPQSDRSKFEAKLFLEINDKQSKARAELKQAIESILRPYSSTAIAKDIILRLARKGALSGHIEQYAFDKERLKTASIVTYGLRPLVKTGGNDSLYSIWLDENKYSLISESDDEALARYKSFCEAEINKFIHSFMKSVPKECWNTKNDGVIKVTIINGLIVCMRRLIENQGLKDVSMYVDRMREIHEFDFSLYKSSQWGALGNALYSKYFEDKL